MIASLRRFAAPLRRACKPNLGWLLIFGHVGLNQAETEKSRRDFILQAWAGRLSGAVSGGDDSGLVPAIDGEAEV